MKDYELAIQKGFAQSDLDDVMVIEKIKQGNTEAFGIIYKKYFNSILRKMVHLMGGDVEGAKDLTSEIMIKVNSTILKYSVESGSGNFGGWINKVAKNYFIDNERKLKRGLSFNNNNEFIQLKDEGLSFDEVNDFENEHTERDEKFKEGLLKLSELERTLIEMKYQLNLPYVKIALKLGISENNCRVKTKRAKEKLKNILS